MVKTEGQNREQPCFALFVMRVQVSKDPTSLQPAGQRRMEIPSAFV